MNSDLHIAFCSRTAAKHACEHWHYSRCMPAGKTVTVGAWEGGKFIGAVVFSQGANRHIGNPYHLTMQECCELTRVALHRHRSPVTRIIKIAVKLLRQRCPRLKLIVSYADPSHGHVGGIYQGGNWIYVGTTRAGTAMLKMRNGKLLHKRTAFSRFGSCNASSLDAEWHQPPEKHKYLIPLDETTKRQLRSLSRPYPKSASKA